MTSAWTHTIDQDGIAWLTFDQPGSKVNTWSHETLREFDALLDQLAHNDRIRAVVIASAKPDSFIVGADIGALERITSATEARSLGEAGQSVFERLEALPFPTVAAIHGACLGGGLEMALACDFRLASDDDKTSLGLPEVNLGILPGWGGTQRLPRVVGLAQALTMILTGKPVSGRKATRIGLADGRIASAFLKSQARAFVMRILDDRARREIVLKRAKRIPLPMRLMQAVPFGRAWMYRASHKSIMSKTHGHYPAPLEALRVIRETYHRNRRDAFEIEARALGELAASPISKNLVRLFRESQRAKKSGGSAGREINSAGVIGAGIMGGGIAWALANAGLTVRMKDITWNAACAGMKEAAGMFRAMVKRRKMTPGKLSQAMLRIAPCVDYAGFESLDLIVEAVVEDMTIKKTVLREIEGIVSSDAIICTNTSSLPIEEMARSMQHPERFVGLHFFNPVNRMQLVEVIPCSVTRPDVTAATVDLVRAMGKIPVVVGTCPGFLVNRILLPYIVEAARMFEEGVPAERIDEALCRFGMPMGPLRLADEVGLDTGYKVAKVLEDAYGPRMIVPQALGNIADDEGTLGRKTGRGFYIYGGRSERTNPEARRLSLNGHASQPTRTDIDDEEIIDRAVLSMVNEAARCVEEGIVQRTEDLDLAMVMGTGFAPFRGGVLRYAEERGIGNVVDSLKNLASKHGDRFQPAPLLEKAAVAGDPISVKADREAAA